MHATPTQQVEALWVAIRRAHRSKNDTLNVISLGGGRYTWSPLRDAKFMAHSQAREVIRQYAFIEWALKRLRWI